MHANAQTWMHKNIPNVTSWSLKDSCSTFIPAHVHFKKKKPTKLQRKDIYIYIYSFINKLYLHNILVVMDIRFMIKCFLCFKQIAKIKVMT